MKKIIFLLIVVACSFSALGQQTAINAAVTIELPTNAKKVNGKDALTHVRKIFKDTLALNSVKFDPQNKYFYTVDNILIELIGTDTTYNLRKDKLLSIKKALDEYARGLKTHSSFIKRGNNNAAVITKDIFNNINYYSFFCVNDANTRVFSGVLKFRNEDQAEATTIFNNLLASIKFRD